MTCVCRLCKKGAQEIGGYLTRVNEKGVEGIWECRPSCEAQQSFEENLIAAIDNNHASQPKEISNG